jgi:hypothetical protein
VSYPIVLNVDFDGVIHKYKSPWKSAEIISDGPVEGAFEWIRQMHAAEVKLQIYTARLSHESPDGSEVRDHIAVTAALIDWFLEHGLEREHVERLVFVRGKPHATLYIDDRAMRFRGRFPCLNDIHAHRQWNKSKPYSTFSTDVEEAMLAARAQGMDWNAIEHRCLELVESHRHMDLLRMKQLLGEETKIG